MALKLYFTILVFFIVTTNLLSNELDYPVWLEKFKIRAEKSGISKKILDSSNTENRLVKSTFLNQWLKTLLNAEYHLINL